MSKTKIGTLSINIHTFYHNYGAILHSWAFEKFLNKKYENYDVEIIDYTTKVLEGYNLKRPYINHFKNRNKRQFLKYTFFCVPYRIRYNKIQKFIYNNMNISKKAYTHNTLKDEKIDYDILISESDVIWSSGFFDKAFFLAFDNMKNLKKIAYAPSMSDGNFTPDQDLLLKEYINCVDNISVRESYAVDIVRRYTEKDVKHVLDPVLLLEPKEYDEIISEPILKDKYLLMYLPAEDNKLLRENAKEYAKVHGLKLIEVSSKPKMSLKNKIIITAGVEDFLSLIKNADIVFTNSFHAVCFSVLFEKEFYAFSRSYAGKVEDICMTLGLNERFFSENKFEYREKINYSEVNKKLENMKNISINWLDNAIREKMGGNHEN